jgi:CheY-like chemotaxis protein
VAQAVVDKEHRKPEEDELRSLVDGIPPGRRILWVDDEPAGNRREIQALRAMDTVVDTATSNAEAVSYAGQRTYDIVLSDIGREAPQPPRAGLELPGALHEACVRAPIAFYVTTPSGPRTDSGHPVFSKPSELLRWVSAQVS